MSDTMNTNQDTQQQPTTPTPEASGDQGGEKMFSQEDVNRIVGEQLAGLFQSMEDTGPTITVDLGTPLTSSPIRNTGAIADAFKPPKI